MVTFRWSFVFVRCTETDGNQDSVIRFIGHLLLSAVLLSHRWTDERKPSLWNTSTINERVTEIQATTEFRFRKLNVPLICLFPLYCSSYTQLDKDEGLPSLIRPDRHLSLSVVLLVRRRIMRQTRMTTESRATRSSFVFVRCTARPSGSCQ